MQISGAAMKTQIEIYLNKDKLTIHCSIESYKSKKIKLSDKYILRARHWSEIPAVQAPDFFMLLKNFLTENKKYYISKKAFETILLQLKDIGSITEEQAAYFREKVPTKYMIRDMEQDALNNKDANLALQIAKKEVIALHRNVQLYWILQALSFDSQHVFFQSENPLLDFFKDINELTIGDEEFNSKNSDWVIDRLAACSSIKYLKIDYGSKYGFVNEAFAKYIAKAKYLEKLDIGSYMHANHRLGQDRAIHVANGLRHNTSIKELDISEQRIGDVGVKYIIKALTDNPNNKVEKINFFSDNVSDVGAKLIYDYILKDNPLTFVNVAYNSKVSEDIKYKIETIGRKKRGLPPRVDKFDPVDYEMFHLIKDKKYSIALDLLSPRFDKSCNKKSLRRLYSIIAGAKEQEDYRLAFKAAAYTLGWFGYLNKPKELNWNSLLRAVLIENKQHSLPSGLGFPVRFLKPQYSNLPYKIDSAAMQIYKMLERHNWSLPGYDVFFDAYGAKPNSKDPILYWHVSGIKGKNFFLGFSGIQGRINYNTNNTAGLSFFAADKISMTFYEDGSGPSAYNYKGTAWSDELAKINSSYFSPSNKDDWVKINCEVPASNHILLEDMFSRTPTHTQNMRAKGEENRTYYFDKVSKFFNNIVLPELVTLYNEVTVEKNKTDYNYFKSLFSEGNFKQLPASISQPINDIHQILQDNLFIMQNYDVRFKPWMNHESGSRGQLLEISNNSFKIGFVGHHHSNNMDKNSDFMYIVIDNLCVSYYNEGSEAKIYEYHGSSIWWHNELTKMDYPKFPYESDENSLWKHVDCKLDLPLERLVSGIPLIKMYEKRTRKVKNTEIYEPRIKKALESIVLSLKREKFELGPEHELGYKSLLM